MKNPLLSNFIYGLIDVLEIWQLFGGFFDGVKIDVEHDFIGIRNHFGDGLPVFDVDFTMGDFDPGTKQSMAIVA